MQTFADLLSARRDIRNDVGTSGNLRFGNKPKLAIPGERPLTLPSEFSGLVTVLQPGSSSSDLEPSLRPAARITLLYEPTFVAPLKPPTAEELTRLGHDPSGFRNENARCACLAVQFRGPDGETIYGVGRLVALENGIRMGKTAVLAIEDLWSADFDVVISSIVELLRDANESVNAGPEPQAKKWQTVVALLGGAEIRPDSPCPDRAWCRTFRRSSCRHAPMMLFHSPAELSASAALLAGTGLRSHPDQLEHPGEEHDHWNSG